MALVRPCTGRRMKGSRQSKGQGGRNGVLLRRGLHPKIGVLLPPPVSIDPSVTTPEAMMSEYSSQEGRVHELAAPDSSSPTLQAMLARVRKREADRHIVSRRISRKTPPGSVAASGSRSSLLLDAG